MRSTGLEPDYNKEEKNQQDSFFPPISRATVYFQSAIFGVKTSHFNAKKSSFAT